MATCWAEALGNCEGPSREHLLSRAIFAEERVTVQGLPWCQDPKEIPVDRFVSKVLCRKHNSQLSPLDAEAGRTFAMWREIDRLQQARAKLTPRRWNVVEHKFDLSLMERWFVKTAINLSVASEQPQMTSWHPGGKSLSDPPAPILRAVFGDAAFPEHVGLYFVVNFRPVPSGPLRMFWLQWEESVAGVGFEAWSFRFFVSFLDSAMPKTPPFLTKLPEEWHDSQMMKTLRSVKLTQAGRLSQVVRMVRPPLRPVLANREQPG